MRVGPWLCVSVLLTLGLGCSGAPPGEERDPSDCTDWVESPGVPELQPGSRRPPREKGEASVCLIGDGLHVGRRRLGLRGARGERVASLPALEDALPASKSPREGGSAARGVLIDLWAAGDHPAREVMLAARALGEAGAAVRLVARRGREHRVLARIEPGTGEDETALDPETVHLWLEIRDERMSVRTTDGSDIRIEALDGASGVDWAELRERLLDQRHQYPGRRHLAFDLGPAVSYATWARSLEVAVDVGFDEVALTPVRELEALTDRGAARILESACLVGGSLGHGRPPVMPPGMPDDYTGATGDAPTPPILSIVRLGAVDARGYLTPRGVQRMARRHLDDFRFCHERAPGADPELDGEVTLQLLVDERGNVQSTGAFESTLGHPEMVECLRAMVSRWTFPAPSPPTVAAAQLPLTFRAEAP